MQQFHYDTECVKMFVYEQKYIHVLLESQNHIYFV